MKALLSVLLILGINYSALSCTCPFSPLSKHLENFEDDETALVFKGSYIQEEPMGSYNAVQFKIEMIYSGEVITPDSPYYNGKTYTNTSDFCINCLLNGN